jgi:hypothetical protein
MTDNRAAEQRAKELIARAYGRSNGKTPPKVERAEGAALLNDVEGFLKRFIVYPSEHARIAHVLWIAHTHLMSAWESTPRIAFLSPEPASGKTRSMEITETLVPDPVSAVNVTPAYMFRKCGSDSGPPTILFDEIDTVFGAKAKEHEEIRALLNSGHRRGATAGRCVARGSIIETEEISSYAAVALAGLGWLPDTILSRSVIIRMRRRTASEKIDPYRRRLHAPTGEALRKRLAGWAATILDEATEARPDMPGGVEDRDADVWESLLVVADIAGGQWSARARAAAIALVAVARDVEPSLNIRLLDDLRTVFGDAEALSTKTILARLHALEDAPWRDLSGGKGKESKPLNDNQLGRRLRQYDIKSKTIRIGDATPKGYTSADCYEAWRRYLPPSSAEKHATSATPATSQSFQDDIVADSKPGSATGDAKPQHDVADVAARVAACGGSDDARTPDKTAFVADVAGVAGFPDDGGGQAGLSQREISRLAAEVEDWAAAHRDEGDISQTALEDEIRRRLAGLVFPEAIEVEIERVTRSLFETKEARRDASSDDLDIPTFLRRSLLRGKTQ